MPLLFSYGTLQQDNVQQATFGRLLKGSADALVGYAQSMVRIEDADVVAKSGKTHHPIVAFTGEREDRVAGTVFEISDAELAAADAYEVDAYRRVLAPLASGLNAWVYVDARFAPRDGATGGLACRQFLRAPAAFAAQTRRLSALTDLSPCAAATGSQVTLPLHTFSPARRCGSSASALRQPLSASARVNGSVA